MFGCTHHLLLEYGFAATTRRHPKINRGRRCPSCTVPSGQLVPGVFAGAFCPGLPGPAALRLGGALGHWEITVARAGHYDLRVLLDGLTQGGQVELRVAGEMHRQMVDQAATSCRFQDVALPAGATQLEVVQTLKDGRKLGAYQVMVTKRLE